MTPDDPIRGPARGSAGRAMHAAAPFLGTDYANRREVAAYLDESYRLAPRLTIDPAIVVSQSALETANWTSAAWVERRNPAGIGIVGQANEPGLDLGHSWPNGADAARGHLAHLVAYVFGDDWDTVWPAELPPPGAYDPRWQTVFAAGWDGTVRTIRDLTGKWATDPAYHDKIARRGNALLGFTEETPMPEAPTFGRVPHPPYDRLIATKRGPGNGFSAVSSREIVGTCVHRTWGYGTGEWYQAFFSIGGERHDDALVDYYVDRRGRIAMLNDPRGTRAPWANGDANGLEGDGPAYVAKLGVSAINARLVSIETEGKTEPLTPECLASLAALIAYWHDQARVPWDRFPYNPTTDCVTQMQHWEFSSAHKKGSGCPFAGVQAQTDEYQAATKEIMRRYQTEAPPEFVALDPPGLVAWDGTDRTLGAAKLWACRRRFAAAKATPVYRYADRGSGQVRAPLAVGEAFDAEYWLESGGEAWALTSTGARVPLKDCAPVVRFGGG